VTSLSNIKFQLKGYLFRYYLNRVCRLACVSEWVCF